MIGIGIGIPYSKRIQRLKYLLDEDFAQGATAAYALRLLREKHSGGIVRCRADDQGTTKGEADVLPVLQPDGSKIITLDSPIENFSGTPFSGDGYVLADLVDAGNRNYDGLTSKWYEQTSNKNDATQAGAASQPKIVDAGSVIQKNGKPALEFDGSDDDLEVVGSNFRFMHDASEASMLLVVTPFKTDPQRFESLINTDGFSSSALGFNLAYGGSHNLRFIISNNGGIVVLNDSNNNYFNPTKQQLIEVYNDPDNTTLSERSFIRANNKSFYNNNNRNGTPSSNLQKRELRIKNKADGGGFYQEIIFYNENKKQQSSKLKNEIDAYYNL